MSVNKTKIYIDPDIPVEQQIAFLRKSIFNFQCNVFEVLKEKLGNEGLEIFRTILRKRAREGLDKNKDMNFEDIKKFAGVPERILGYQSKQDYNKPDEFQFSVFYCPLLEESKRRGIGKEICEISEEVEMEEVSKRHGELTEPTRMCQGNSKCTIRMRNTR